MKKTGCALIPLSRPDLQGKACVYDPQAVRFEYGVELENYVEIQDGCEIESDVIIRSFCRIGHHCVIGARTTLKNGVILSPHIDLGEDVFVSPHVVFMNHQRANAAGTSVEDHVFIGTAAMIMPGVHIGRNVFIGPGSLVTRDLKAGCAYMGNPLKKLRTPGPVLRRRALGE